jgi:hypothetical protein
MKKVFVFGMMALLLASSLALFSCSGNSSGGTYTVKYEITGPAIIANTVLYYNESGALDSLSNVSIPWTKTITVKGSMIAVGCGFTIHSHGGNTYIAKIFIDGKEVKSATTTAGSATVTHVIN